MTQITVIFKDDKGVESKVIPVVGDMIQIEADNGIYTLWFVPGEYNVWKIIAWFRIQRWKFYQRWYRNEEGEE